jgi:hypothetical protein
VDPTHFADLPEPPELLQVRGGGRTDIDYMQPYHSHLMQVHLTTHAGDFLGRMTGQEQGEQPQRQCRCTTTATRGTFF